MDDDDLNELIEKHICFECVGESYLSNQIAETGAVAVCSYCGTEGKCFSIGELAERVETAFQQHYTRTSDQPNSMQSMMLADKESDYDWERDGEQVVYAIMNAADISEQAATDIQQILEDRNADSEAAKMGEESPFDAESYYEEAEIDDQVWQEEWHQFEQALKTESRFFSSAAGSLFESVFKNIDTMRTRDDRPLVVDAVPGAEHGAFFRARAFQSEEKLRDAMMRPDLHIGPPPAALSRPGRMNANGISVFYGASDAVVAIAEVRPPVGSFVAVARFDLVRPLRLLDLTAVQSATSLGSIFDPSLGPDQERAKFLRSLARKITRPVMPDDEAMEYLSTQVVADFLSNMSEAQIDGILFPSVQANDGQLNVVLFHKASRVQKLDLPKGTKLSASTGSWYEDGWESEYEVREVVPPETAPPEKSADDKWPFDFDPGEVEEDLRSELRDGREVSLVVALDDVHVHLVAGVKFSTEDNKVVRRRSSK